MNDHTPSRESRTPDIGLLIVHGIGEQKQGETSEKLVRSLSNIYGSQLEIARDEVQIPIQFTLDQRTIRLYEVYWADILSGDRIKGSFRWELIQALGWFPWFNWKHGLLDTTVYSRGLVFAWSLLLVPTTLMLYLVYTGARFIAQLFRSVSGRPRTPPVDTEGLGWWERTRVRSLAQAEQARQERTFVEDILDEFAGDMTNYMFSVVSRDPAREHSPLASSGPAILNRFYRALARALDDDCSEIQILSHSLGSVISYHGLTGLTLPRQMADEQHAREYHALARLTRLYTIGCPLEKIRLFWPTSIRETLVERFALAGEQAYWLTGHEPTECPFTWDNFYHKFDLVSGRLVRFDHWCRVDNHPLAGGGGLIRSHVIYEQSPEFLALITERLFGAAATPRQSRFSRWRDRALSLLENLALPLALAVLLLLGLGLSALAMLIPGYLLSLPFRLFGAYEWAHTVQSLVALFMLAGIVLSSIVGVKAKAREIFAKRIKGD